MDQESRQVAHSSRYQGLCPVHRSFIAMSGSSEKVALKTGKPGVSLARSPKLNAKNRRVLNCHL